MKVTSTEAEVILRARSMFETYKEMLDDTNKSPEVIFGDQLRVYQVLLHRHPNQQMKPEEIALDITKRACYDLLEAIEADARDEMYETLGTILAHVCSVCTGIKLDFCEVARGFDSQYLDERSGEGITGMLNLFKSVGALASCFQKNEAITIADAGVALFRICAAVHWLAFSNDIDASVMFQDVLQRKLIGLSSSGA